MSYKDLKSYQQATIIYDLTANFCDLYIDKRSRTHDQMVQAARSGKQNIVEGVSEITSGKSELKLLGVARASFQELLEDYEDFLRQKGLRKWNKDSPDAKEIRDSSYKSNRSYESYRSYIGDPETAANVALCLIHQTNYLLDLQIRAREKLYIKEGGYSERLSRERNEQKKKDIISRFWRKYE